MAAYNGFFFPMDSRDMTEPVRLSKRLAAMVSCSRREAELYIEGGWVSVDGRVVLEPQFRVAEETVALHPDATIGSMESVTILLHQPLGSAQPVEIAMENHAADDPAAIRPLARHFSHLKATLPLEAGASGLLVLTQDWRVMRKLVEDAATVEQEYVVEVEGELGANGLARLNHGFGPDGRALAAKVSWQNETRLRFAVKGPKPGQIAFMCRSVGLQAKSMKRIRIGKISMSKMPPGQWRYLAPGDRF